MQTRAIYYDGESSHRHIVTLRLADQQLLISGAGLEISRPVKELRISDPLGSIKRSLYLPNGGKCAFENEPFARQLEHAQRKSGFFRGVHRWENSLKLALAALVVTVALVLCFIQFGIPLLAEQAAYAIPPATEITLGKETLQILDKALFEPSQLDAQSQAELTGLFEQVVATLDATERPYRLELRSSPRIGANAFALPGGTVIMTDELVAIAEQDEEIAAVLAHEVGHVRHRHAMRQVLQDSAVGLIVATLTGDVFSATSLAASLPTMLVDAKFSRDMERQADDVAVEYLAQRGQNIEHFAAILTRLEQAYSDQAGGARDQESITSYFSSHPATQERLKRLKQ